MRLQFPGGVLSVLKSSHGVKLVERKLNQNPLYFVTYNGVTIHCGTRKHCARRANRYINALEDRHRTAERVSYAAL